MPAEQVAEVSGSADFQSCSFTDANLQRVLCISHMTCALGSGTINNIKPNACCLEVQPATTTYGVAAADTSVGAINADAGGLEIINVPMVTGEVPRSAFKRHRDAL